MLNEQLGFRPEQKLLIVHIDDVGMCHSENLASLEALRHGTATCGSVMMPCPWIVEIAEAVRETPELDLGIHACFTSEWERYKWGPVAPRGEVPSLTDSLGYFPRRFADVAANAEAEEFERELRAQVERALALGIQPTHLDTHMGTCYARMEFFEIYLRTGKEYGIPPMIFQPTDERLAKIQSALGRTADRAYFQRLEDEGYVLIDHLCKLPRGDKTLEARRAFYHEMIRSCRPGVNLQITHMATDSAETSGVMGPGHVRGRFHDYRVFMEEEVFRVAEDAGVELIGWRALQQVFNGLTGLRK